MDLRPITELPASAHPGLKDAVEAVGYICAADGVHPGSCIRWQTTAILSAGHVLMNAGLSQKFMAFFGYNAPTPESVKTRSIFALATSFEGSYFQWQDTAYARLGSGHNSKQNTFSLARDRLIEPQAGMRLLVVGYQRVAGQVLKFFSDGAVTGLRDGRHNLDISASLPEGFSGGAVLTEDGRLLGIAKNDGTYNGPKVTSAIAFIEAFEKQMAAAGLM